MLLGGILLGLILGLLAGGRISNLGTVRLRWVGFLFAAVLVRFTIETALGANPRSRSCSSCRSSRSPTACSSSGCG